MAEGSCAGEMRSYDPGHSSQAKKRRISPGGGEEPMRKMSKFGMRRRFEPVQFVSGSSSIGAGGEGNGPDEKENDKEPQSSDHPRSSDPYAGRYREYEHASYGSTGRAPSTSSLRPAFDFRRDRERHKNNVPSGGPVSLGYGGRGSASNFMAAIQQDYAKKYETHSFRNTDFYSQPYRHNGYRGGNRSGGWDCGRQGLGYSHRDRPHNRAYSGPAYSQPGEFPPQPPSISPSTIVEKYRLITCLASALAVSLSDPQYITGTEDLNYSFMLSRSIQVCRTNPQYTYVNLRDIPQADLPKNRKVPTDGYACELRCQGVYLATGYSFSKNGARDRASELAVRLLMKPVEVRVIPRKYKHKMINDIVVCQMSCPSPALTPALRNPKNAGYPNFKGSNEPDMRKRWTEFVVLDNAQDAICILNNSAAFCHMKVDYRFERLPNLSWMCSVYVQDEMVAQASGTKKNSKHAAAEAALAKLRLNQAEQQRQQLAPQHARGHDQSESSAGQFGTRKKHLSEVVILENSDNAVSIINDTAQFNNMTANYKFICLSDNRWRCEVYLEGQFVAAGVGAKKQVKHFAAQEAIDTLRQTQAVVKSTMKWEGHAKAISRSEIQDRSGEEAMKQVIKEDNIGNQLLRKMGWTGGGLGRDGEGIAEPIKVKEKFSREGLGMDSNKCTLNKRNIEGIISNYARSDRQDDLHFSTDLTNNERKRIHLVSHKYGLRSKSYGQGRHRYLVVSRRVDKNQLIGQLLQEGQVGRYELVKPQTSQ
ncbi:NF-kappa-B-repressing factor [Syngnathus scovelli]|uniref:NF-kappa-B-repressing factor n=1 Tax=Syngnathus scovelli TaxID=161590 RepID=UPI00210F7FF8|nr:NF-kappa-B-repressing factor [Syngnathus scovelli]